MTDISNLKPGDALTYEQAMALPDGAVVSAVWGDDAQRTCYTAGGKHSRKFGGATLARKGYWNSDQWHSVRLESLPAQQSKKVGELKNEPELPVWVINCDRCGTTYKNNERHACAASEPAKIVIQESGTISKSVYESLLPERKAGEIEKLAALTALGPLFEDCHDAMRDAMDKRDYDYLYDFWTNVEGGFRRYREMYDYAKSIGAIE